MTLMQTIEIIKEAPINIPPIIDPTKIPTASPLGCWHSEPAWKILHPQFPFAELKLPRHSLGLLSVEVVCMKII